ncbi:MAG: hypothetical protein KBD16_00605 [Candidatus Pacebacteria bacterium]|nr:hypothetical protein [Candidatus Paceibacterota bacterium]
MTYNFPLLSKANEGAVATLTNTQAGRSLLSNVIPFTVNTQTNQTLTISIAEIISDYKDYADQAQSNYANMAEMGTYLGKKLNERAEALSLANHAAWTDFGDTGGGVLGLASTDITPSATNIDDICRGIIEQIQTADGWDMYMENGGFIEWRPQDWTFLVQYMQSMGFTFADEALKTGGKGMLGKEAMGLFHYVSTSHASGGHLMAGVRKAQKFGILSATYGKVYKAEMPASSTAGSLSGTQIHTRLDYGFLVPTNLLPVVFDINV